MPRAKSTTNTKEVEIKETEKDLNSENQALKSEIQELRSIVEEMIKVQKSPKQNQSVLSEEKEEFLDNAMNNYADVTPRYRVRVTSLYHGGLNIRGLNKDIRFEKFGHSRMIYFEDLESAYNNNRKFLEQGFLFIHDDRVVKLLYLEKEYQKIVNADVLKKIFEMPVDEIDKIYNNTTKGLQREIVTTFAEWVKNNDPFYLDKNKIETINRLSGRDVIKMAEALKEYDD